MKVDRVHEKFIYHPKNLPCCYQIWVYRFTGSRRVRCVVMLLEHMKSHPQSWNRRPWNAMTPDKKPSAVENFSTKFSWRVKNATSAATSFPVAPATKIFRYTDSLAHRPKMWGSHQDNKPVVISHLIFRPSSTICISLPFYPPFSFTPFPQHVYFIKL
jgi:hypothetical protein